MAAVTNDAALAEEMIKFIDASPTPFHMCAEASTMLLAAGFVELAETDAWRPLLKPGGKYFYVRGGSLVAFFVGAAFVAGNGFNIVGAHTDSPVLKLKPCSKKSAHGCIQINVEAYGGGLWHTWFDRELSLAGSVIVKEADGSFRKTLIHVSRPLLRIPNLCIHLTSAEDRGKFAPNKETHLQVRASLLVSDRTHALRLRPIAHRAKPTRSTPPQAAPSRAATSRAAPSCDLPSSCRLAPPSSHFSYCARLTLHSLSSGSSARRLTSRRQRP